MTSDEIIDNLPNEAVNEKKADDYTQMSVGEKVMASRNVTPEMTNNRNNIDRMFKLMSDLIDGVKQETISTQEVFEGYEEFTMLGKVSQLTDNQRHALSNRLKLLKNVCKEHGYRLTRTSSRGEYKDMFKQIDDAKYDLKYIIDMKDYTLDDVFDNVYIIKDIMKEYKEWEKMYNEKTDDKNYKMSDEDRDNYTAALSDFYYLKLKAKRAVGQQFMAVAPDSIKPRLDEHGYPIWNYKDNNDAA